MKTKKKSTNDLDVVIGAGKAQVEEKPKRRRGRPKSNVEKIQSNFHLSVSMVEAINENCRGNKSAFIEEVLRYYFDSKKIKYKI